MVLYAYSMRIFFFSSICIFGSSTVSTPFSSFALAPSDVTASGRVSVLEHILYVRSLRMYPSSSLSVFVPDFAEMLMRLSWTSMLTFCLSTPGRSAVTKSLSPWSLNIYKGSQGISFSPAVSQSHVLEHTVQLLLHLSHLVKGFPSGCSRWSPSCQSKLHCLSPPHFRYSTVDLYF